MSYPGCLSNDCWGFRTFWLKCTGTVGGTVRITQDMEKCICTTSALTEYTTCYPCLANGLPTAITPTTFSVGCSSSLSSFIPYDIYFPVITKPALPTNNDTTNGGSSGNGGSGGGGSSNNTALYAGIGAGSVVLILGVALFFYFRKRDSKNHNPTMTTKADAPGSLPPMQLVQQSQYLQPQPQPQQQQHLYAQQPVISCPPQQTFDQHMNQYLQPMQVPTSGYYLTPTPMAANSQQQHQQGQQTMMFHQPTTLENATPTVAAAAVTETYIPPPMPVPMPAQSSSYAITSPTATVLHTPVTSSPNLTDESSIKYPAVSPQGPQGLVVSKDPQLWAME